MRRHLIVTRMCPMPYDDFQSFLRVLTQISPAPETFGWKIFVMNRPERLHERGQTEYGAQRSYISVVLQGILL
jgi:hypothetical protein